MFEYKLSLNRVRDKLRVVEGGESLLLTVDGNAAEMVVGLTRAQAFLKTLTNESTDDEKLQAARLFAEPVFGKAQAAQLLAFYNNDAVCVIDICGRYFAGRLNKLIAKAQKK